MCGACVDFKKKKFLNLLKRISLPSFFLLLLLTNFNFVLYIFVFSITFFVVVVVLEISSSSTCTSYSTTTGLPLFKIIIPSLYPPPFYSPSLCLLIQHSSRYLSLFFSLDGSTSTFTFTFTSHNLPT